MPAARHGVPGAGQRVGGHGDDPRAAVAELRVDEPGGGGPVELGHPDVHEHDVVGPAPDRGHRLDTVAHQVGVVAQLGQLEQHQTVGSRRGRRRPGCGALSGCAPRRSEPVGPER